MRSKLVPSWLGLLWRYLVNNLTGGQPVKEHDLFDITFDINIIQPFISNFSLNMVDIEKIASA